VPSRKGVEVWVANQPTGRSLLRQLIVDENPGVPNEGLVALQTAELLRTTLLSRSDLPPAPPRTPPPDQPPPPPAAPPAPPTIGVQAAAGMLYSPGAGNAAMQLWTTAGYVVARPFGVAVDVSAPLGSTTIDGPEGSARVRSWLVGATLFRYEGENTVRMLSIWTSDGMSLETPETWAVGELGLSRSTAADNWPGRVDDWTQFSGPLAQFVRDVAGVTSSVSSPILVEGRLWGALAIHSRQDEPLPANTEVRVSEFTGLVATAISNIQARSELSASRARIVAATDEERRRVVRDLHDGAQQRLVHTVITLKLARRAVENEREAAAALLSEALAHAEQATSELRELAHGILPAVLTQGGLRAGVNALASRMPVPVENDVSVGRLPAAVEATAYFVVAEALTNVAKHARAERAGVTARVEDGTLVVHVRDDGVGGAQRDGSGLTGLTDRLAALDGELRVESPVHGGTVVAATIPLPG